MPPAARTVAVLLTSTCGASRASPASTPSGHCSREPFGGDVFQRGELPGDERALDAPAAVGRVVRSHCPATTASWCSPSTSWRPSTAAAKRFAALPTAGATASAAYRHCLARMRTACSSGSGGSSPRACTALRSFFHGLRTRSPSSQLSSMPSPDDGIGARRRHQAIEQRDVPVGPHRVEQLGAGARRGARGGRRAGACRRRRRTAGSSWRRRLEPFEEHVVVAHGAEERAEPLQLVAESGVPLGIDDRAERLQVGAQPAGRDPGLVHGLDVFADPHARDRG